MRVIYTSLHVFTCSVSGGQLGGNLFRVMLIGVLHGVICCLSVENVMARNVHCIHMQSHRNDMCI